MYLSTLGYALGRYQIRFHDRSDRNDAKRNLGILQPCPIPHQNAYWIWVSIRFKNRSLRPGLLRINSIGLPIFFSRCIWISTRESNRGSVSSIRRSTSLSGPWVPFAYDPKSPIDNTPNFLFRNGFTLFYYLSLLTRILLLSIMMRLFLQIFRGTSIMSRSIALWVCSIVVGQTRRRIIPWCSPSG